MTTGDGTPQGADEAGRAERGAVRPAFATRASAVGFATLLAFFLLLPVLLAALGKPTRSDAYRSMRPTSGPYRHIEHETLELTSDVDIVFTGTSTMFAAIDARLAKEELSKALGREATVFALGHNWSGLDVTYALLKDLCEHRKVGTVVILMPVKSQSRDVPHAMAHRLLDYHHHADDLRDLSPGLRAQFYGDFVLGAPRHLLSAVRRNRDDAVLSPENLGSGNHVQGFDGSPFEAFDPAPPALAAEAMILSPETAQSFTLGNEPLNELETAFVRKITKLVGDRGGRLVSLAVPFFVDVEATTVVQQADWRKTAGMSVVGVPPVTLFGGLDEAQKRRLFYNISHLNVNGARFFTRTVMPALTKIHVR